jgi:hypothetical protein
MKKQKFFEYDREKKIHKVEKGNKQTKYRKQAYSYVDEFDDEDLGDELHLDDEEVKHTT